MADFIFGCVFGVVALYAFLEYRDWQSANKPDDDEDDIP